MEKVIVTANEKGQVIVKSENNPEFGFIRTQQTRMVFDLEAGFVRKQTLSALVAGKVEDLKSLGWVNGQQLPGTIIVKEQLTPFNKKDATRDLKIAGKTKIVCEKDGQPIYRNTFYSPDAGAQDVLVVHTNQEEIKQAYTLELKTDLSLD